VLRKNLPTLTEYGKMPPYNGDFSYASLKDYLHQTELKLSKEGNAITLKADKLMNQMLKSQGKETIMKLKRDNYNLSLKDWVTGANNRKMLDVIDGYIVPRTGIIYLTPHSTIGRAPFYSSEKIIGQWHIKTLWYNLVMLLLMSIIAAIMLYTDCPGRYIRKEQQS
jgi:hypothetical protein